MKNRRAIVFFLACSAVFSLALSLAWTYRHPVASVARATLSDLNVAEITSVEIGRTVADGRSEQIAFVRAEGRWRLEKPIQADADEGMVKQVVNAVVFAEVGDVLTRSDRDLLKRTLRDFGLAAPTLSVTVSARGRRETYSFGRPTAAGNEVYVQQDGLEVVFTVPVETARVLGRPLGDFRRHNLFAATRDEILGIGLKDGGEPFSKLVKTDGAWRLAEPVDAPADRAVAERLLETICSERIVAYADDGAGAGLDDDEGGYVLSLRNSSGGVEKAIIGAAAGTNEVWAKTSEGAVVRVRDSLLTVCRESQRTVEDTRVFPVEAAAVTSITVDEGYPAYVLSRKTPSDPWRLASPVDAPADADHAEKLLSGLLALRGIDIMLSATNTVKVSVSTETTNFPPCAVLGKSFIGKGRLADLRDRTLIRYPAAQVKKVRVRTSAGVTWDATKYEALIKCLEEGLAAESVDVIAPSKEDFRRCGFDRPSFTFTFELDDPASSLRTLLLGAAAPGGGRYATIGGLDDASFVLSAATVSILTKPVEETLEKK